MSAMRAAVFAGARTFHIEEVAVPELLPGTALVKVEAVGICGSDLNGFAGITQRRQPGTIMGHEIAGRVHASYGDLKGLEPGALVAINPLTSCGQCRHCRHGRENLCLDHRILGVHPDVTGGFAEFLRVPVEQLIPLDQRIDSSTAALLEPLSVAHHAIRLGGDITGEDVLVLGGGTIGIFSAVAAARLGARHVTLSEPREQRRELIHTLGYETIDPTRTDIPEWARERTHGEGLPVVIDAVGAEATVNDAIEAAAPGAVIVVVGLKESEARLSLHEIALFERSIVGSYGYTPRDFQQSAEILEQEYPALSTLVGQTAGLNEVNRVFNDILNGTSDALKVVITP